MLGLFRCAASWRVFATAVIVGASAVLPMSAEAGGSHLYVMLGLGGMSPGLSDFGDSVGQRGIPTTVGSYTEWETFAQEAIHDFKSGRVSSIIIVGHSLGGSAARAMAAELGEAHVPVKLLVTLDPVGDAGASSNVHRSVNILPGDGEDHFSMITGHERQLRGLVLGDTSGRRVHARARNQEAAPGINFSYGAIN